MVTQITPINLVPGTMIPRVNISQYDTGARVLKFQVYNGDSLFTFTNAMSVALVGTKPDGKGFSYTGTIASNMPTFDVTAQMSAVAGKVRAELVVFENGERVGSGNFVIFVEEGALGDGTDMSESDYAIINDALEAAFDLEHFYADLQGMVTEAVEDIQVIQGQTVIDPTLTVSGAAADAKATGDMARNFLEALMTETTTEAGIASIDDGAGGLPLKQFVGNIQPTQAGSGDPSLTNIRPISGYSSITVKRTGKNLIDDSIKTVQSASTVVVGQTSTSAYNIFLKAGTYTVSFESAKAPGIYYRLSTETSGSHNVISYGNKRGTFTLSEDAHLRIWAYLSSGIVPADITWFQLETGDSATEYAPYNGATYTVTIPSEAGTVYGGTLTVNSDGTGILIADRACFTSEEFPSHAKCGSTTFDEFFFRTSAEQVPAVTSLANTDMICSHAVRSSTTGADYAQCRMGSGQPRILFPVGTMSTLSAFNDWLAEQVTAGTPLQFSYILAEPTTYALSAVQVAQMVQGENNVWMDVNGTVQVTYYANTALYVDKKIAELQALVLENQ